MTVSCLISRITTSGFSSSHEETVRCTSAASIFQDQEKYGGAKVNARKRRGVPVVRAGA